MQEYVPLLSYLPDVKIDLKYASTDNFAQKIFYSEGFQAMMVKDAVLQLVNAQNILYQFHPKYRFVIWDAARPHVVQKALFDVVKNTPQEKYIAHPEIGSLHNYGCAIDIGIIDENGQELDFGTIYDYFGDLAEPSKEIDFLHQGKLSQTALANRLLLRFVMTEAGFQPIPHEWWHFNFCSIEEAKSRFEKI